jgi:AcrR family transcriptional regulator
MEAPMANKSNNRTLIMDAVAKIITNDVYGSVSMSQVAKLTGLSVATAYNYFANKQDMIITTYHEACERLNQYIINHISKNGAPDVKLASYCTLSIKDTANDFPVH